MILTELHQITKTYIHAGADNHVLHGVELQLEESGYIAVRGPSGSGKSTLLQLLGGMMAPTSGTLLFKGESLYEKSEEELSAYRNGSVGFIFQDHKLLPQFTVLENVLLPVLAQQKTATPAHIERAMHLLEKTAMDSLCGRTPMQLSGGECQRVAICRALMMKPALILADEPTGSLDARTANGVVTLLSDLQQSEGAAVVLVTHSQRIAQAARKTYALEEGKLHLQ